MNVLELKVIYRDVNNQPSVIYLPATDWPNGDASVQKYTAGCLARGDAISVKDYRGKIHVFPAGVVRNTEIEKAIIETTGRNAGRRLFSEDENDNNQAAPGGERADTGAPR